MRFGIGVLLASMLQAGTPCGTCHKAQATVTPMTQALDTVERCAILRANSRLEFSDGSYRYTIIREGSGSTYSVTDGKNTITVPLSWAFGLGGAGQTYVFARKGQLYESRVSFYKERGGLDLTMGAQNREPANLEEAAGRAMSPPEAGECFGCHATDAVKQGQVHLASLTPGLQCVRCHAGGETHAAGVESGNRNLAKIAKLAALSTEEMSNFCGQCHRTWADIATNGPRGINNVRFQPYRLANSKCYDAADLRIACTSCHDPHQAVSTRAASYDSRCQSCHSRVAAAPVATCPIAKQNCTECHMPKFDLPGAHHQFTDHQIRIVRAGEAYPN